MKYKLIYCLVIALFISFANYGQEKLDLNVLYVGYQPNLPISENLSVTVTGHLSNERFKEEYKTRYIEFINYLKATFTNADGIDARGYKSEMSEEYDVTIFDQITTPISEVSLIKNDQGQTIGRSPAKYLDEDFTHAAVLIGHVASSMTQPIGSKFNWYCLCLDADAYNVKTEHPIFKGPLNVSLTFEKKTTPTGVFHYPNGVNMPKETSMWQVQTEGYLEGKGYRIGLVSSGGSSFLDSPDVEYISGGVSTKSPDAVAIGRHGNYMLWGFSASPNYMTEEAKKVLKLC